MAWPTITGSKRSRSLILSSILAVLFMFLFSTTVSAQQTPPYVFVFLEKEWAGLLSPPPGVGSFRILASANWIDGNNNAQSSRATCSYAGITLSCVYSSTVTSGGVPLNGVGLVAPYG